MNNPYLFYSSLLNGIILYILLILYHTNINYILFIVILLGVLISILNHGFKNKIYQNIQYLNMYHIMKQF